MLGKCYTRMTFEIEENWKEKLKRTSEEYHVSMSELVRMCVASELPRILDREKKRRNYRRADDKN